MAKITTWILKKNKNIVYEWFYGLSYLHVFIYLFFLDKLLVSDYELSRSDDHLSVCFARVRQFIQGKRLFSQSFYFNVTFKSVFFSNAELTWTLPSSQPHCWMSRGTRACSFYVYGTTLGNSTWSSLTLKLYLVCPEPQLLRSARRIRINRS